MTGSNSARDRDFGDQIHGLWADSEGNLKAEDPGSMICRWSLHRGGIRPEGWKPRSSYIRDGDNGLKLHCHSFLNGGSVYRDVDHPPIFSPSVLVSPDGNLRVYQAASNAFLKGVRFEATFLGTERSQTIEADSLFEKDSPDTSFLRAKDGENQDLINRFDCGQTTEDEERKLMVWQKLYGIGTECLQYTVLQQLEKDFGKTQLARIYNDKMRAMSNIAWDNWHISTKFNTKFNTEALFRVKYVYPD